MAINEMRMVQPTKQFADLLSFSFGVTEIMVLMTKTQGFAISNYGFIEVALLHPLDLVKTRFQLQKGPFKKNDPNYYNGVVDCFRKLYNQEGVLSFWKGILPPLIIETPTKSVRFTSFHFYRNLFSKEKDPSIPQNNNSAEIVVLGDFNVHNITWLKFSNKTDDAAREAESFAITYGLEQMVMQLTHISDVGGQYANILYFFLTNNPDPYAVKVHAPSEKSDHKLTYMVSGYCAGITESFMVCPFEVIKVTQQSNRAPISHTPSAFAMAGLIIHEGGVVGKRGIYRGLGATLYRHSIFNTIYLGLFYAVREHIPATGYRTGDTLAALSVSVMTGSCACVLNIPFDVVKSRIQAPQPKKVKYRNTWQSIGTIVQEEGYPALFKGLWPKILRLGPGGAIMIFVFEFVENYLSQIFL